MQTIPFKAGDTFSYSGIVSGLSTSYTWAASSAVSFNGVDIGTLTTTLVHNSDYATTGNLLLTLSATGAQTAAWMASASSVNPTVLCDIKFSNSGSDPIVHSDTFAIALSQAVSP